MSILIKGMEMPTNGELLCINIYPDGKVCIALDLECTQIATAVPIPPHGRLIDADAQIERAKQLNLSTAGIIKTLLDSAPAIIEAEGEGKNNV